MLATSSNLGCSVWERFRQHYPPLNRADEVKLEQEDVAQICRRVVDHDLDTQFVAEQFDISRWRVQQLAKEYRESGEIPQLETLSHPDIFSNQTTDLASYPLFAKGQQCISRLSSIMPEVIIE